jgi:GTP-binding protein Era
VGTKLDLCDAAAAPWPPPGVERAFRISARIGTGIPRLLDAIVEHLPESPPLFPASDLSDRPVRFLAAELIREAAFEELAQELPYSLAVEVLEFDEADAGLVRIRAQLLVERRSQKQIAVGRGGSMIKCIGTRARLEMKPGVPRPPGQGGAALGEAPEPDQGPRIHLIAPCGSRSRD